MKKQAKLETSKAILFQTFWAFWVLTALIVVMAAVFPETGENMVAILQVAATLAGAVHVGYFGKAGVENYKKIESAMRETDADICEDEG